MVLALVLVAQAAVQVLALSVLLLASLLLLATLALLFQLALLLLVDADVVQAWEAKADAVCFVVADF